MRFYASISLLLMLASCATASRELNIEPRALPLPRIGIRQNSSRWEFFDKSSDQRFYVQGVNWVRLGDSKVKWPPNISFNKEYFQSHHEAIRASLLEMGRLGYNVVRVRLDAASISGPDETPVLNSDYVDHLIDFIRMAAGNHLYVLLTGQWLPKNYYSIAYTKEFPRPSQNTSGLNLLLLSKGHTAAYAAYEADLIRNIKQRAPELMPGIFALDLWNELYFDAAEKPFSEASGIFITEEGLRYDLGKAASRQKLADDAAISWVNAVSAAIKKVDPELLLTSSVFTPLEVQRAGYEGVSAKGSKDGDPRQPFRLQALNRSSLDYLQIHPYPHSANYNMESDLQSLEYFQFKKMKPVLIGEFGIYKKDFKKDLDAVFIARSYISQICRYQLAGWLYWTWDTGEQPDLWNMKEDESAIAEAISPRLHPTCNHE